MRPQLVTRMEGIGRAVLDIARLIQPNVAVASSHTGNKAARHATSMVAAAVVCLLACAKRDHVAATGPSPPPFPTATGIAVAHAPLDASTDRAADVRPEPLVEPKDVARDAGVGPARSISSPCVLHAGEGKRRTHKVRLPSGVRLPEEQHSSCSANAECIATHGQQTPGDGFVSIACTERTCTCTLEPLQSSRTEPSTSNFEIASPCATADKAMRLMVQHCMTGMTVLHR